jgi:hypothetical protein
MGVAPYTFRNENSFLPADFQRGSNPAAYGDAIADYRCRAGHIWPPDLGR